MEAATRHHAIWSVHRPVWTSKNARSLHRRHNFFTCGRAVSQVYMVLVSRVSPWDIVFSSGRFDSLNMECCTPLIYYQVPGTTSTQHAWCHCLLYVVAVGCCLMISNVTICTFAACNRIPRLRRVLPPMQCVSTTVHASTTMQLPSFT